VAVHQLNEGGESLVRLDVRLSQKLDYSLQRDQNQLMLRFARPEKAQVTPKTGNLDTPVSLSVQDADLVGVLKTLSEQAGFEYQFTTALLALVPPTSLVTAKIENRPFREVIDTLLVPVQANFMVQGNTLFFGSSAEIDMKKSRLPLVQRTYAPKNLTVNQCLLMLVANFKRPDELNLATKVAAADPRDTTRLLLVGTSEDVASVLAALARFDVSESGDDAEDGGGGQARTQVFHLQYADSNLHALILAGIQQLYPVDSPLTSTDLYMDDISRTLVVTTQVKYLKKIEKLLARLDVRPAQVNIEGKIVEMDQGLDNQLGVNWSAQQTSDPNANLQFNTNNSTDFVSSLAIGTLQNGFNISATLQALVDQKKADLVSSPNVTTNDNQAAEVNMSDNQVLVQNQQTISNGTIVNNTVSSSFAIPLDLKVTPLISKAENRVTMKIHFTLSTATGAPPVQGSQPPTSTQAADTVVNVQSGETAVIGGMVSQNATEEERKVPVLGDIPLLGMLFKFNAKSTTKKEVIIFITPTIVEE
jgi:type II secretory pathway component HofQ